CSLLQAAQGLPNRNTIPAVGPRPRRTVMDLRLHSKRAFVTGSSSGIGEAIAKALAREGASVVVHGRRENEARRVAKAIADAGGKVAIALGDLATDEGAAAATREALAAFGGI